MREAVSVYFSSAGRRVELMRCFRDAGRQLGIDVRILAGDLRPDLSPACCEADIAIKTPPYSSPDFLDVVRGACVNHGVRLIIPTIDPELILFSQMREAFARDGITISVSADTVVELARDKLLTANWLEQRGFATPATMDLEELRQTADSVTWPLLLKPKAGSASKGIYVAKSIADLHDPGTDEGYVAQALLIGQEYTTNVFFDPKGRLRAAVPHIRYEVRAGEVSKGETVRNAALIAIAEQLGQHLRLARGALCFQSIIDADGKASIFEINARFGGGYPLTHRAGAPFAKWLLAECLDGPVDYNHEWKSALRMLRYDSACFI
ncbi:MAG: ATP-grasp domain-containing protein [Alphaproteobacteria bacterium]|nr:MAG: ATP-grasp domain-containing protein [Alphaproteobacteria bacterium]